MTDASENLGEHVPRLGVGFPLAAFEQRIEADPDVLGMILTGSLTRDAARTVIVEAIYYTVYVNVHNVRGSHYHAMANLCELAGGLYGLVANARGREGYDVRNAEQFLRADELALLYATRPVAPEPEAVRRAARGLWEWTRYVWAECEQALGEELGIALDTTVLLEVIERPYA